jgi:hypothetical protein
MTYSIPNGLGYGSSFLFLNQLSYEIKTGQFVSGNGMAYIVETYCTRLLQGRAKNRGD